MAVAVKKYNPGFLADEQIIDSFCVRTAEFESLVESLRESGTGSSPHSLVIGPRGSGKTHLLLRVAAEVRRNPDLTGLFPVVFAEESYEVTTCGELWLECLGRLAEQAPNEERDNLRLTYEELRTVTDDQSLTDRCLGTLLDYADRHATRLLLIVENLNMLFSDINDPDLGWRLRQTLQTEPRIILLGSATSRFDEIDNPNHALYDLFRVISLHPLSTAECETLWRAVAGKPSTAEAIRPLEILTGGNPRLLAIIGRFGAERSFRDLMENLLDLVDEHTEYFKSHLEALPPQERRVYLALARLWKPSSTREIADLARLNTSTCSAQLKRLVQRGTVAIEGGTPRRRQYYLAERLYNIYYLLRRGTGADCLVQALIDFMTFLYSKSEFAEIARDIYENAHATDVLTQPVAEKLAVALDNHGLSLQARGKFYKALDIYDSVLDPLELRDGPDIEQQVAVALSAKLRILVRTGKHHEALALCNVLLDRFTGRTEEDFAIAVAVALGDKGTILSRQGDLDAALDAFDQSLARFGEVDLPELTGFLADILYQKGLLLLRINQLSDASATFSEAVSQFSTSSESMDDKRLGYAIVLKAFILYGEGRAISETEFKILLACLAGDGSLLPGSINTVETFVASVDPSEALRLVEESSTAPLLLPLVTALQQELGQTPQVAKEVAEVASDVRARLREARARLANFNGEDSTS